MSMLQSQAKGAGILLTQQQVAQFDQYRSLLLEWNDRMDLTNITDPQDIDEKHFLDSLSLLSYLPENFSGSLLDVGTGAGFPGIPLKIALPEMQLTLLDGLQKRIHFLDAVCDALKLQHVRTLHGRAEEMLRPDHEEELREAFDVVTARAVAPLSLLLEVTIPALRVGGVFLAMKGPNVEEELEASREAMRTLGAQLEKMDQFQWTEQKLDRTVLMIRKTESTPLRYPRRMAAMRRKPL